jgi:hypothetical protein
MSAISGKNNTREAEERERHENASQKSRVTRNIGDMERLISSILGGTLLIGGLTRRSLPGLALFAMGAAFLYRGATGHCSMYESLGIDTHHNALNSNHASNQSHDGTRLDGSIEKNLPSLTPRRKQTAKAMIRRKGIVKAATVSSA